MIADTSISGARVAREPDALVRIYGKGDVRARRLPAHGPAAGRDSRPVQSLNDVPEVRETFATFDLVEVSTTYTISGKRNDPAGGRAELLISNYSWERA